MLRNNKTCILCGKVYTFCNRCEEFDHLPRWMAIYCSDNCKEIFVTATNYKAGEITKEKAYERLSKCDLSDKNKFHQSVIDILDEILSTEEKKVKKQEEVIEEKSSDNNTKRIKYSNKNKQD